MWQIKTCDEMWQKLLILLASQYKKKSSSCVKIRSLFKNKNKKLETLIRKKIKFFHSIIDTLHRIKNFDYLLDYFNYSRRI